MRSSLSLRRRWLFGRRSFYVAGAVAVHVDIDLYVAHLLLDGPARGGGDIAYARCEFLGNSAGHRCRLPDLLLLILEGYALIGCIAVDVARGDREKAKSQQHPRRTSHLCCGYHGSPRLRKSIVDSPPEELARRSTLVDQAQHGRLDRRLHAGAHAELAAGLRAWP